MQCNNTGDVLICPEWTFQDVHSYTQCKYHRCVELHHNDTHDLLNCSGVDFKDTLIGRPTSYLPMEHTYMGDTNVQFSSMGYGALSFWPHDSILKISCLDEYQTCLQFNETSVCYGATPAPNARIFVFTYFFSSIIMLIFYRLTVRWDIALLDLVFAPVLLTVLFYLLLWTIHSSLFVNIVPVMLGLTLCFGPSYYLIQRHMSNKRIAAITELELQPTKEFDKDPDTDSEEERDEFV